MSERRQEAKDRYAIMLEDAAEQGPEVVKGVLRFLSQNDLFFLLTNVLNRKDADNDWCFDRCEEVQEAPDGYLDLWSREHYKSTIITFAKTIQDILIDPDLTVGIFSHTRPIAKAFLRQIKREFENNKVLLDIFPDVMWPDPQHESPKWSEDEGIIIRRSSNPKEATVEAWGLVDGQPTSKHYKLMVFDDVVTRESITSPEMIEKTTKAWEDAQNLTVSDGSGKIRHIGTRWHFADTYREIIKRGSAIPRIHTEVDKDGNLALWTPEIQAKKRKDMGPYTYACQIKQDPGESVREGFKREWLLYWPADTAKGMNIYILCDPAGEKKKENDYTVFMVIGTLSDENYYTIRMIRDRLNLVERGDILFRLHREYKKISREVKVGYEKYGKDSDIEYYQERMTRENYRFRIIPLGGAVAKNDRIRKLIPLYEAGRMFLPDRQMYTNYEHETIDMVQTFIEEEYLWFPFPTHDDMLDCQARILDSDLHVSFPGDFDIEESSKYTAAGLMAIADNNNHSYDPLRFDL